MIAMGILEGEPDVLIEAGWIKPATPTETATAASQQIETR
jgi:hypothetical protein